MPVDESEIHVIPAKIRTIPVKKICFLDYSIAGHKVKIILDNLEVHIWDKTNLYPEKLGELADHIHNAISSEFIFIDIPQDLSVSYYSLR